MFMIFINCSFHKHVISANWKIFFREQVWILALFLYRIEILRKQNAQYLRHNMIDRLAQTSAIFIISDFW